LQHEGYIVIKGVLSEEDCNSLRTHVLLTTDEAARKERNDLFGNIQEAESRHDLKLDLCEAVVKALNQFTARCGDLLTEAMGSRVRIVELAAITSDQGSVAQPVHADTMHGVTRFLQSDVVMPGADVGKSTAEADSDQEDAAEDLGEIVRAVATETALIFTSLLALQDIDADMGPTHVWPATHTVEHHATLWSTNAAGKLSVEEADKAFGIPHKKMTLSKGDLVLYDSRTMHCGGANSTEKRRSVLCISTMGQGIRPDGTTWTLLPSLRNRLLLSDFPLCSDSVKAPTVTDGCSEVHLPPKAVEKETANGKSAEKGSAGATSGAAIPPLEEWQAALQCSLCRRWRPCSVEDAPRLTALEHGAQCSQLGFSCMQEQVYSTPEIDAIFG